MEELPLIFRVVTLLLLLGVNAFFAAAEVALVSVRETRMRELASGGSTGAKAVLGLIEFPDRMLSATQLGVTLASLGLGWAGESTVYALLEPLLVAVLPPGQEEIGHIISFVVAFSAITYFHMVLGEVVPKNFAIERSEGVALLVAPPLELFARATHPFVSLVKGTAEKLSRLLGLHPGDQEAGYSPEELKLIVSVHDKAGEHARRQQEMLHKAIDFFDLTVREIMVPRQEMVAIPVDAGVDQVIDSIARNRFSRLPVYDGARENVVGIVYVKELWSFIQQMRRWQMLDRPPPPFVLGSFLHSVEFVPETKQLYELLKEFQSKHFHMAIVVDEFGTVSGLATLEDALEQIVGEIREEHEKRHTIGGSDGPVELDGITNIRDLETQYDIELPYDAGFETLAGFLLSQFGRIPEPGDAVEYDRRAYRVLQMDRNRISRVRIEPVADAEPEPAEPAE